MIEKMLVNTMLVLGVVMLVLVIDLRFRKYSRQLLWAEGLAAIIGSLLSIGLGWIRLFLPDGYPNFPAVMTVTEVLIAGGMFIILAEKQHKKEKERTSIPTPTETPKPTEKAPTAEDPNNDDIPDKSDEIRVLPLKGKLDTPLAAIIFKKALESGLMSIEQINGYRQFYHWKGSKVLLSYMSGHIYCGDTPEKVTYSNDVVWKAGSGKFPSTDLGRLFNENNLGNPTSSLITLTYDLD